MSVCFQNRTKKLQETFLLAGVAAEARSGGDEARRGESWIDSDPRLCLNRISQFDHPREIIALCVNYRQSGPFSELIEKVWSRQRFRIQLTFENFFAFPFSLRRFPFLSQLFAHNISFPCISAKWWSRQSNGANLWIHFSTCYFFLVFLTDSHV